MKKVNTWCTERSNALNGWAELVTLLALGSPCHAVTMHDGRRSAVRRQAWQAWQGWGEKCCAVVTLSSASRSDEMGVSYEAISTSNRTVQRGSRFAAAAQLDCSSFFFIVVPVFRDAMRCACDAMAWATSCY